MVVMSLITFRLYEVFLCNPLINPLFYIGMVCLGGISLSLVFTMLSAIAAKAGQNAALMAIMGFPLVIPMILILVNATQTAFLPVRSEERRVGKECGFRRLEDGEVVNEVE